ncbi:hypothetical protein PAECIP111894_00090 [Paenibacillus pseudetheri]|uniref:Secreted protein n=1 Tax=Paenibacillus pseudetheri TaxID=2897682 RepID=A0ABM9B627_9BACL|nr:hypothetical protein PAECIP111894_00090 [Paenibacillus pseudetheri]
MLIDIFYVYQYVILSGIWLGSRVRKVMHEPEKWQVAAALTRETCKCTLFYMVKLFKSVRSYSKIQLSKTGTILLARS